ncbi:subtilisin-like protein [Penicillium cataractarum]|uniref:Subtilisin-like protein n=1 Tax=Penicillium cataractarum TaxID=2100454 RepID=A0A9W9VTF1_9EURO|nr:subtilisin-like protein [Penicillium cataractarum]KAJ5389012.1 subtilisin-like protein [Penicillium cataractarum]
MPLSKVNDKIRIAILDTGVDLGHPYFDEKIRTGSTQSRRESINECKSFLPGKKGDEDAHGHGTHAASLLLRLAPNAKVYVARVVDDDGEISNPDAVAEAINYASDPEHWGVHIISMSLGWKNIPESVERAIKTATMTREVFIFAAASNNGPTDDYSVTYPARAMMVFPVFAASSQGELQRFNPSHEHKKGLSTLGVNVTGPWTRHGTEEKSPTRCRSGTSIATPIMAASAALALQYIYQKPPLKIEGLYRLEGIDGMVELLSLMRPIHLKETPYFVQPGVWLRNKDYARKKVMETIQHIWYGHIQ